MTDQKQAQLSRALRLVDDILLLTIGEQAGFVKDINSKQMHNIVVANEEKLFAIILAEFAPAIKTTDKKLKKWVSDLVSPENLRRSGNQIVISSAAKRDFLAMSEKVWGKKISSDTLKAVDKVVKTVYSSAKEFATTQSGIKVPTWTLPDIRAAKALDRQFTTFLSTNYKRVTDPRIREVVSNGFKMTLDSESIARQLEDSLSGTYNDYKSWNQLASYETNFSRNVGQLFTYRDMQVAYCEYVAIIDERTTEFCLDIDGQIISVDVASNHADEVLDINDPDDIMSSKPFVHSVGGGRYSNGTDEFSLPSDKGTDVTSILEQYGVEFPPFHYLCRTTTEIWMEKKLRGALWGFRKFPSLMIANQ